MYIRIVLISKDSMVCEWYSSVRMVPVSKDPLVCEWYSSVQMVPVSKDPLVCEWYSSVRMLPVSKDPLVCEWYSPVSSGGSKGGVREMYPPPGGPNSFNFMQFLGKFGKIILAPPPGELAPPPQGNPGSATGKDGASQ